MSIVSSPAPAGDGDNITRDDLARFRAELLAQFADAGRQQGPIPWPAFRERFLALYLPPHRARGTYVRMRNVCNIVGDLIGPAGTTADLTANLVARFIERRPSGESSYTTRSVVNTLRVICNHAALEGFVRVSPFALRKNWIRLSRPQVETKRHHSAADIQRVLDLARATAEGKIAWSPSQWRAWRTYAVLATAVYTGMRKLEILHLRVEDIDLDGRMLLIVPRSGNRLKTAASAQPVPIADALAVVLEEWLAIKERFGFATQDPADALHPRSNPGGVMDAGWAFPNAHRSGPWIGGSPGKKPLDRLKTLGRRLKIEGLTFLSLRHSFSTHAESLWGFSEVMIQRILRHTSTRTQASYRHADPSNLRAAMKGIGFGGEPAASDAPASPPPAGPAAADPVPAPEPAPVPRRKLTDEDVVEMKELRARGWALAALAARYQVGVSTIHGALNGLTHRHVPPHEPGA